MSNKPLPPFKVYAGHSALELVNTFDLRFTPQPIDLLPTYAELLRFAAQLRVVSAEQARRLVRTVSEQGARRALASAKELREALADVFYAPLSGVKPQPAQVQILQAHFQAAFAHRQLRAGSTTLGWTWAGNEQQPELPVWKLAQSACDLLVSSDAELVKDCGDPACRWLFLDVSKNHTRRWCDMKTCGNRMKARRYQARLQDQTL